MQDFSPRAVYFFFIVTIRSFYIVKEVLFFFFFLRYFSVRMIDWEKIACEVMNLFRDFKATIIVVISFILPMNSVQLLHIVIRSSDIYQADVIQL